MEANVLRLILLIAGIAFIVGIYLWERRKRDERRVHAVRREPGMSEQQLEQEDAVQVAGGDQAIDFDQMEEGVRLRPSRSRGPDETPPPVKAQGNGAGQAAVQAPGEHVPVPAWALKKPEDSALARELGRLDTLVKEAASPRRTDAAPKERSVPQRVEPKFKGMPGQHQAEAATTSTPVQPSVSETPVAAPTEKPAPTPVPEAGEQIAFPFAAEDHRHKSQKKKLKDKGKKKPPVESESEPPEFPTPILSQVPPKIMVINVVAKREPFAGEAILSLAEELGLRIGDMNIFHRQDPAGGGKTLFSMASMVEPGSFPVDGMASFTTPGLSLFTQLPGAKEGLALFNDMLAAAEQLAKRLGGEMQDDSHSVLTRQTIEHLRGEVIEHQRRQRLVRRPA